MKSLHKKLLLYSMIFFPTASVNLFAQEEEDRPVGDATDSMIEGYVMPIPRQIIPAPQETYWKRGVVRVGSKDRLTYTVELAGRAARTPLLAAELEKKLSKKFSATLSPSTDGAKIVFALEAADLPGNTAVIGKRFATLKDDEGYIIDCVRINGRDHLLVLGKTEQALWRALASLVQLVEKKGDNLHMPSLEIIDYPELKRRALLTDLGGQGFMVGVARWNFNEWKDFIDWMVDYKLNEVWLEIIGSGRLMGNLNPDKGEWIGYPVDLKSYPQVVGRDRPIRRWDEQLKEVVDDTYTMPNVKQEFARELIDYAKSRGIRVMLFIGYDYFSNQFQSVLGVPGNRPDHPEANKVYDGILKEVVSRYDNADGVVIITIENKGVPPTMVDHVVRRAHEARKIIRDINPGMEVGILNDYLEWRPREEFERYAEHMPTDDIFQVYTPHTHPQNKSWKRMYGNVFRYELYSQYAWDHAVYIFPERIRKEMRETRSIGFENVVSQAWYFDVMSLNYMTMSECAWNSTGRPLEEYWDIALERVFGAEARDFMRTSLAHTRFDRRQDIVARMILGNHINREFRFWDMYSMTVIDGLKDDWLADMEVDAKASLDAANAALPLVSTEWARELVNMVIKSAERRYYLARCARHLVKATALRDSRDLKGALAEMEHCVQNARDMNQSATSLGIEYPMAMQDARVLDKCLEIQTTIQKDGQKKQ